MQTYDLLIIGAGLSGTGIAADAASRGLSVCVLAKGDEEDEFNRDYIPLLTSGIRHLEQMNLALLWRSLREQKLLQLRCPELCQWRWAFIPSHPNYIQQRQLEFGQKIFQQISKWLNHSPPLTTHPNTVNTPGIYYPECLINNKELLLANEKLAIKHGAVFKNGAEIERVELSDNGWLIQLNNSQTLSCKAVINATGAKTLAICENNFTYQSRCKVDICKSQFFILDKQHYPLEQPDLIRLLPGEKNGGLYCMPIKNKPLLIIGGLTQSTSTSNVQQSNLILRHYQLPEIQESQIQNTLFIDYSSFYGRDLHTSIDYALDLLCPNGSYPLLNVLSGATSNYRLMAEQAIDSLLDYLPKCKPCQTRTLTY
ncbi:MAG: FAD-dependent oxidoreductase [Pseudomonadales bacterium]|nr:FAD-dependent oxidoreductase [Pseudomonadales bacterium]